MHRWIFLMTALAYLAASGAFFGYLRTLKDPFLRLGRWILVGSLCLHWGSLVAWMSAKQEFLPSNSFESRWLVTAVLGLIALALSFRRSSIYGVVILLPLTAVAQILFHLYQGPETPRALPNAWIWTHIFLMLFGEVLFFLSAAIAIVYLLAERSIRVRSAKSLFLRVKSLPFLDELNAEITWAGFILLSVGMILGFVSAHEYWNDRWWMDPKVIFCVLSWLVFASLLTFRMVDRQFRGKRSSVMVIIGFLSVIFLSWGLDWVFPSQHTQVPAGIEKP